MGSHTVDHRRQVSAGIKRAARRKKMDDQPRPETIVIDGEEWHDDGLHQLELKISTEDVQLELTCHGDDDAVCHLYWHCPQGCEQEPCVLPGDDPDRPLWAGNHDEAGLIGSDECLLIAGWNDSSERLDLFYAGDDRRLSSLGDYRFVYRWRGEEGFEWQLVLSDGAAAEREAHPLLVLHQTVPFVPEPDPLCGDDFAWRGEELSCQGKPGHFPDSDHYYVWPASNRRITWASVVT